MSSFYITDQFQIDIYHQHSNHHYQNRNNDQVFSLMIRRNLSQLINILIRYMYISSRKMIPMKESLVFSFVLQSNSKSKFVLIFVRYFSVVVYLSIYLLYISFLFSLIMFMLLYIKEAKLCFFYEKICFLFFFSIKNIHL